MRRWRVVFVLAVVVLAALAIIVASGRGQAARPHVVIVLIDTLRADHTSLDGYRRNTTPHLERISREGLTVERNYVNAPWTKPSVASIISGLHPSAHGSRVGQFEQLFPAPAGKPKTVEILSSKIETMAELLREHGYKSLAFLSNYHLTRKFGYDQGFDEYHLSLDAHDDAGAIRSTIDALRATEGPLFVWCHLMSVHQYAFPDEFARFEAETFTPLDENASQFQIVQKYQFLETMIADYDNAILYADSLVGALFDYVRSEKPNTLLIITSDHGEEFYDHGGFEHVRTLYNELLRVPLVIWGPDVPVGTHVGLADSIDLLPTLLAYLGIKVGEHLDGELLFEGGRIGGGKDEIFAEKHHRDRHRRFALIHDGRKLIVNEHKRTGKRTYELYADGLAIESQRVTSPEGADELADLRRRIDRHRAAAASYFRRTVGQPELAVLEDADIERLRALGYIR